MLEGLVVINGNGSTFDAMDEEDGWGRIWLGDAIMNDLTIKGSKRLRWCNLGLGQSFLESLHSHREQDRRQWGWHIHRQG